MTAAAEGFKVPGALKLIAGVFAFTSMLISAISILLHFKNYRKPMDQRLVVRIQLLLPLFALSSWLGLVSNRANSIMEPVREIYEAFVIYTFFTLLTNILGGERDIIISTSGRAPKSHLWPLNYCCNKVDISDPYTFLAIKRGILQYTWLKPILSLSTIIMEATGTFQSNTIGLQSGYMWIGLIYNVSISVSLYSLALFWYCLLDDLAPYRPFPKFLCVKIIIFFSYWQGFLLSILVFFGIIPDTEGSGSNNIARAIQNSLMCIEMLGFAIGHWYAFSYQDYATSKIIGFARLPVWYAIRDAFGIVDLMIDFKSTFWGRNYGYRQFDSIDDVLAHPESRSRRARINAGLRYRSDGRSKYWLPKSTVATLKSEDPVSRAHLLEGDHTTATYGSLAPQRLSPAMEDQLAPGSPSQTRAGQSVDVDSLSSSNSEIAGLTEEEMAEDDELYQRAKMLKYGDYNYPVITVRESIEYKPVRDQQKANGLNTGVNAQLQREYDEYEGPSPEDDDDYDRFFA